jgi:hypothetical protein
MAYWKQGETPTVELGLDVDPATVTVLKLVITQTGGPLIKKTLEDSYASETTENTVVFPLTQEDTISLDHRSKARIQAHGRVGNDPTTGSFVTDILEVTVGELLDPEVI